MLLRRQEPSRASALTFARDGAQYLPDILQALIDRLRCLFEGMSSQSAGNRLTSLAAIRDLVMEDGPIGSHAAAVLGAGARPVRALLFDKSPTSNWRLGWHQDRVIAVKERREAPGFHNWTVKSGQIHVSPPFELMTQMATLRVHLDEVDGSNAPLLIAPGSHKLGKIPEPEIDSVIAACGTETCLAHTGDVWLYATPILHASNAAENPSRRRVLQLDYSAAQLPHGLEWNSLL